MNVYANLMKSSMLWGAAVFFAVGCSKSPGGGTEEPEAEGGSKYFISATSADGSYLLTTDNLTSGQISIRGNGIEVASDYTWVYNNQQSTATGLIYAQGDPGVGLAYGLNANGQLVKKGSDFQITSRFTTYGDFDKYIVTSVGAIRSTAGDTVSSFTFIDLANNNNLATRTIRTSNFTGNGDYAVFSGIVDGGNGDFYTSALLSSASAAPATNGLGRITYPDSVWVALFDADLRVKRIFRDNRISYSTGRMRSRLFSQITKGPNNDVYVFSGAFESTTTKPAGVIRIRNGATSFDPDFYVNIQQLSGGYKFRRVWYISDNYFLLEFYNTTGNPTALSVATNYAVLNTANRSLSWLSASAGFPALGTISSVGDPLIENGKAYIPITTTSEHPTVYVLDPATSQVQKGLVIEATDVNALLRFTY
ncbi:DUF4374 domain-containing protein [Sphingobacterium oryzagri]|uniref:DUF4374 domain-containing protein n=1 Tax=Sphingobacterium oryzagri TaxID=3025669 RepID=A0ABY7WQ93_9SPHI|nr:DUF4374 domain-containing protein [Sphingobacterium sp. KACC 22765]WDF70719.1 DUF4374 domain-containing protein [Sphingobacterium sp. KACC 22765]